MNIALVGPGIIEIPPKGWGAVESLIWDYATELDELGHDGVIIDKSFNEIPQCLVSFWKFNRINQFCFLVFCPRLC